MAKAKCYALHLREDAKPEIKKRVMNLSGQARLVFEELRKNRNPRLAQEITDAIGNKMVTVQDPNRVTVYYLMMFEKMGIIKTTLSNVVTEDVNKSFSALVNEVNGKTVNTETENKIENEDLEEVEN